MIECEFCYEWYYGKCFKIVCGKVKEDDKYICLICDWCVKILCDVVCFKFEDLVQWYEEIISFLFWLDEEEVLKKIIDNVQNFCNYIVGFCSFVVLIVFEVEIQCFYLCKIEGVEIFLVYEINFF